MLVHTRGRLPKKTVKIPLYQDTLIYPSLEDMLSDDLDVPSSKLDDQEKSGGSRNEENNYYNSLGGYKSNDLAKDTGK